MLLILALPAPAAEDYEDGKRAYLAGDYAQALTIWQPLAEGGNRFAQFSLGSLYFEGAGVDKDLAQSARWFRAAAEQGYAPAEFNLGNAYKHGNGVEQDDAQATDWWRKAAEQNFAPAQFNLGTQYYFGRGVPKDEEVAIAWYRRAAENGHAQAQRLFSMSDTPGKVTPPPESKPAATPPARSTATAGATAGATAVATTVAAGRADAPATPLLSPAAATPAGAPGSGQWLQAQNPEHFTLQLLATQSEDLVVEYLDKHQFQDRVAYFGFDRDGKRWYAAVYGAYPGKTEAEAAVTKLPADVKQHPPWIRQFGGIQKIMITK